MRHFWTVENFARKEISQFGNFTVWKFRSRKFHRTDISLYGNFAVKTNSPYGNFAVWKFRRMFRKSTIFRDGINEENHHKIESLTEKNYRTIKKTIFRYTLRTLFRSSSQIYTLIFFYKLVQNKRMYITNRKNYLKIDDLESRTILLEKLSIMFESFVIFTNWNNLHVENLRSTWLHPPCHKRFSRTSTK